MGGIGFAQKVFKFASRENVSPATAQRRKENRQKGGRA
jgi:hypothetical protein